MLADIIGQPSGELANIDAEAALLGALFVDNSLADRIADSVCGKDFALDVYGRLFDAVLSEISAGRSVSPITLKTAFGDDSGLQQLGGIHHLVDISSGGSAAAFGIREFADQIAVLAAKRRLVALLESVARKAADPSPATNIAEIVDEADAALVAAVESRDPIHQPSGAECIDEVLAGLDRPRDGVRSGIIASLDDAIGPMRPKQLVVGAGRPAMGKTALALSYARGAAARGHGVLFVSLEMSSTELGERLASEASYTVNGGIPYDRIRDGNLGDLERRRVRALADDIRKTPLQIVDTGTLTIGRLRMMVRRWKRRMAARGHRLELVIVDYAQLVRPDRNHSNEHEGLAEVSRGMKAIAKDEGLAVFALAQLNRAVESRDDKRPQLSDLRGSGQWEQDADVVFFPYREEYYLRKREPEPDTPQHIKWMDTLQRVSGRIDFIVAKRRNGAERTEHGHFFGAYQAVRGREFYREMGDD